MTSDMEEDYTYFHYKRAMSAHQYQSKHPGGRLNKKDGLTRYGNSHVKDKTS